MTMVVEVLCIDAEGRGWYHVNDSVIAQGFSARRGLPSVALGVRLAVAEYEFREYEFDRACASLRHSLALRRQPWPVRKVRALLRKLGGEFVYEVGK